MSGFRVFIPTAEALEQGKEFGLDEAALMDMARRGTPVTHEVGNRRFKAFWMLCQDGKILAVGPLAPKGLAGPVPSTPARSDKEKREAKLRVELAIAKHFPKRKPDKPDT